MARPFCKAPRAIAGHDMPPEGHGPRMTHIFDNFPITGKAVEYQRRGVPADSGAAILHAHEKLRHPIIRGFLACLWNARTRHQRKSDGISTLENQEWVRLIVGKPVGENLGLLRIVRADDGKQSRIQISQGFNVFAVDTLDPLAILF